MRRISTTIAALCAVAIVSAPVAQAAPPRPEPVTTVTLVGATAISIDPAIVARWKDLDVRLAPRSPATQERMELLLPASQITNSAIRHHGGWVLVGPTGAKLTADDVVLRLADGHATAAITVRSLRQDVDLLTSDAVRTSVSPQRVKRKGPITTKTTTTTITGPVRLIDDPGLILMMNGAIGAYALKPGETIGTFTTTLIETTTITRPKR